MNDKMKYVVILGIIALVILKVFVTIHISQPHDSLCGGESHTEVTFSKGDTLTDTATRSLYFDLDNLTLWMGGASEAGGTIAAYSFSADVLEVCRQADKKVASNETTSINDILKWKNTMAFATDGEGVWLFDLSEKSWQQFNAENSLFSNNAYALAIDPRNDRLVVATWDGMYSYDGEAWSQFDLVPPQTSLRFHAILPVSQTEWFFGGISNGTIRYLDGQWERFSDKGVERWDEAAAQWVAPYAFTSRLGNNVRDLELRDDGSIAIVTDNPDGSGIAFLYVDEAQEPYDTVVPQDAHFSELTAVINVGEVFVVTNYTTNNGGAYYYDWEGTVHMLTSFPSFDVLITSGDAIVATKYGVIRVGLPFESKIQCADPCIEGS